MGIEVYIWGHYVGALVQSDQGIAFQYHPEFKKSDLNISPVYLPLNGKDVYLNEPEWKATQGIPGVIYDSLPDTFGNNLLEVYFFNKGLTKNDIDVFSKLQYIGARGMGALEYKPATDVEQWDRVISMQEIQEIAMLAARERTDFHANLKDKKSLLQILHIGTSAGGARAKALIAINKATGDIRSGQMDWGEDYDPCLMKIDGANAKELGEPGGYGRLEYTYYQMATACGIQMSECWLHNGVYFVTKRFDRLDNGEKLHAHSLCGLLSMDYQQVGQYSYEHYFTAARRLGLGYDSLEEIFRRMVFNVLAHNCDDHTKNFLFLMNQDGRWSLSPAFDVCYSYDRSNEWVNGHNMRVNGKRTGITFEDLMIVGKKFNIRKREMIIREMAEIIDRFKDYADKNNVDVALIEEVEKNRPRI